MNQLWNRKLWGALFTNGKEEPKLLGAAWDNTRRMQSSYDSPAPSRALLFNTRREAQAWCKTENVKWQSYPLGHVCRSWRVRAVRVREIVEVWQ